MKKYPFTNIVHRKIFMPYIKGNKVVKLLNLLPCSKKDAETFLIKEYGYMPYSQTHFKSIIIKFIEGYWLLE